MGRNSKSRRAAKATSRAQPSAGAGRPPGGDEPPVNPFRRPDGGGPHQRPSSPHQSEQLRAQQLDRAWWQLMLSVRDDSPAARRWVAELTAADPAGAGRAAERVLLDRVAAAWTLGWQPVELRRHARIGLPPATARLVELAILAGHARFSGPIDARWQEQVAGLDLRDVSTRDGWVAAWSRREGHDRAATISGVTRALELVAVLPRLEELIPPPGRAAAASAHAPSGATSDPMLARIRKLLAKAESTEFEAEAAALTSKAQELMTRHAIDQALLDRVGPSDLPTMIRLPVDAPYADAKSLLLQVVAEASRSRAVFSPPPVSMSTVLGHRDDLAVVELLFTSLLVQAQHALTEAARTAPPGTRTRSQSYRSAFLLAFCQRIRERLTVANEHVYAEAAPEEASRFLPVLRAREDAVEELLEEQFGSTMRSGSVRGGYDAVGAQHGRRAADLARLDSGELTR